MKTIAVLIPAFNEARTIRRAIWSAYVAGFSPADVYVVDDGSTDETEPLADLLNARVTTIVNGGKARAILHGLRHFSLARRYRWIALLDADSMLDHGYRRAMLAAAERHPNAGVLCGAPRNHPHNWLTAYRAVEYAISLGVYREAQDWLQVITVAPGCASMYRATTLESLDFAGETLVEDMDLTIQLHRRCQKLVYVPDALVYTQDPRTLRDYIGQIERWYRGTWQVVRRHRLCRRSQRIDWEMGFLLGEGLGFALLMLVFPLIALWSPLAALLGLAIDQSLLLTFTALVALRERRGDVLWAFPLFSIPRVLNSLVFLRAFISERRGRPSAWFSVERYS